MNFGTGYYSLSELGFENRILFNLARGLWHQKGSILFFKENFGLFIMCL